MTKLDNKLNCTRCPNCSTPMQSRESRPFKGYGFLTQRRRRWCHKCNYRISTVEIPRVFADAMLRGMNLAAGNEPAASAQMAAEGGSRAELDNLFSLMQDLERAGGEGRGETGGDNA